MVRSAISVTFSRMFSFQATLEEVARELLLQK